MNHISLQSAAPKAMQGDFRGTVEAHRDDARSCTYRGVAAHAVILPGSRPHSSRQYCLKYDRNGSWQTDLPTVRMSAQQQIKIGMSRLAIDFRCVRQQDGELAMRYLRRSFFDVIDPKVVRVIDSGQIDLLITAHDHRALVEQH